MPIPAALGAILTPLLGNGLNLVANAVMAKGKDYVEKKLGVELKPDMSSEDIARIKIAEMEHEVGGKQTRPARTRHAPEGHRFGTGSGGADCDL
jgi:hypothetical protein